MRRSRCAPLCPEAQSYLGVPRGRRVRIGRLAFLAHRLLPHPFKVRREQLTDILDSPAHHVQSVYSETPCQDWNLHAQRLCDFRSEDSAPAKLHPAIAFPVGLQFDAGFCEWKVVRLEPDLVRSRHLLREHLEDA